MAPEYAMFGQLSVKADVYSFGVVLLEIVSGRRVIDIRLPQEMQILLEWVSCHIYFKSLGLASTSITEN